MEGALAVHNKVMNKTKQKHLKTVNYKTALKYVVWGLFGKFSKGISLFSSAGRTFQRTEVGTQKA